MLLAGDIGATKTHLALFDGEKVVAEERFRSHDFKTLSQIVYLFLEKREKKIEKACFGIAGPVEDGHCKATNLPWIVDVKDLERDLQIKKVFLINDLEATAYGLSCLKSEEKLVLNPGKEQKAQGALIAAGTGLGEAGLLWDGNKIRAIASEGGHADFAPRSEEEIELWHFLRAKYGHVSYERVLSGPGIYNLYRFLIDSGKEKEDPGIRELILKEDPPRVITAAALSKKCPTCMRTLDWFISIYAGEAGNLALKFLSLRGLFIGGGIAPKIVPLLKRGHFIHAFCDKGRFSSLLSSVPVYVILNENAALLGAAEYARSSD